MKLTKYSIFVLMQPNGNLNETWKGIIGKPGRNNNFWLNSSLYIHHRFKTNSSTNTGASDSPHNSIKINEDNLVQIEHTGSLARDYVNGKKLVESSVGQQIPVDGTTYIARNLDEGTNYRNFKGYIKEILIFDRALTTDEKININYYLTIF